MMEKADPVGARAWLKNQITANRGAFHSFLGDRTDMREELLAERFPYKSGPLPPIFMGIASVLLLNLAETDRSGYAFLSKVMARLVRSGEPIPEIWREMHANILEGQATLPKAKGRSSEHNRRNDLVLLLTTYLQQRFQLPILANKCNRNGDSAIEIVVDELGGLCPSLPMLELDSLEKAINRRKKAKLADPILGILDRPT